MSVRPTNPVIMPYVNSSLHRVVAVFLHHTKLLHLVPASCTRRKATLVDDLLQTRGPLQHCNRVQVRFLQEIWKRRDYLGYGGDLVYEEGNDTKVAKTYTVAAFQSIVAASALDCLLLLTVCFLFTQTLSPEWCCALFHSCKPTHIVVQSMITDTYLQSAVTVLSVLPGTEICIKRMQKAALHNTLH